MENRVAEGAGGDKCQIFIQFCWGGSLDDEVEMNWALGVATGKVDAVRIHAVSDGEGRSQRRRRPIRWMLARGTLLSLGSTWTLVRAQRTRRNEKQRRARTDSTQVCHGPLQRG